MSTRRTDKILFTFWALAVAGAVASGYFAGKLHLVLWALALGVVVGFFCLVLYCWRQ